MASKMGLSIVCEKLRSRVLKSEMRFLVNQRYSYY